MSPMIDFSDTTVRIVGAFFSGLFVYWLFRALFGNAAHRAAEVFSLSSQLDTAKEQLEALNAEVPILRSNSESHAAKAAYYEKQFNDLFANWLKLSRDAGDVSHNKSDLEAAKKEIESLQIAAKEQATKIENALQAKYDSEIANLTSELKAAQNASGQASWLTSEVRRLTNEMSYAARDLQTSIEEKGKLEAEVSKLSAALASAYADLRSTLMDRQNSKDSHVSIEEKSKLETEVSRLSAALSSAYADLRSTLVELQNAKRELQKAPHNVVEPHVFATGIHRQGILDSRVCNLG